MNRFKHLQLQKLDQHMAEIRVCERPSDGWIRATRMALGMSVHQLAIRMGMTQQAASQLEANELDDSVTIKTLRKAAEALGCKFVYAIVPLDGSLQDMIRDQAAQKAREIVTAVDHTMQLEAQGVGDMHTKIQEIAQELSKNPNSRLWE